MARGHLPAFAAACVGIALYSVMDAVMKGLGIAMGAYGALFWRMAAGAVLTGALFVWQRSGWPGRRIVRVHAFRSAIVTVMAVCFFWGIVRVPLAEAVALSFIAPLIALGLAALFLKERIAARSVGASVLGLIGVAIILAGRLDGAHGPQTAIGMAAILVSAIFYAANLVVARHQAQLAKPIEIAFFQNLFVLAFLALAAPFLMVVPAPTHWPGIVAAAMLGVVSLLFMSWAYARAEAQVLLSVEYTAFIWAALMGWLVFGEALTLVTVAGTGLIVAGCWIAARGGGSPALPDAELAA